MPKQQVLSEAECVDLCDSAWIALVWATRKVCKGQYRAAVGAIQRVVGPNLMRLLYEEAVRTGAPARIDGAGAEKWLAEARLAGSEIIVSPDSETLGIALLKYAALLQEVEKSILGGKAPARDGLCGLMRDRLSE